MQNQQDQKLLEAFHLMSKEERDTFLLTAQIHTEGRQAKRPALTLLHGGFSAPSGRLQSSSFS
jgi:hypothetical protein